MGAQQLTLDRQARVGSADAGEKGLTRVSRITVGSDGSMFIVQAEDGAVTVFAPDGSYLRRIGRLGGGPGEFRRPDALGWASGELWIADPRAQRVSFFGISGDFRRSISLPTSAAPFSLLRESAALFDGTVVARGEAAAQPEEVPQSPLLRFRSGGADTLAWLARTNRGFTIAVRVAGGEGRMSGLQPFADDPLWALDPEGTRLVLVNREAASTPARTSFSILVRDLRSEREVTHTVDYEPTALSSAMVDSAMAAFFRPSRGRPPIQVDNAALRRALYLPRHLPPVTGVIVGRDGSIWLRREDHLQGTATKYTVIRSDGAQGGEIYLPATHRVLFADQRHVWILEPDELDVPFVTRYAIR